MATFPSAAAQFAAQNADNGPIQQYGRVVGLQNAMQEQQLRQQLAPSQVQSAQNQVEMQQMQMQSQKGLMQAIAEGNGDVQSTIKAASKYGVLPQAMQSLAEMHKNFAEAQKVDLENQQTKHNQLRSLIDPLTEGNPGDLVDPMLLQQAIAQGQKNGLLDGANLSQIPQNVTKGDLKTFSNSLALASNVAEEHLKTAQAAHAEAETAQLQPFTPDRIAQLNQGMQSRWQVLHPQQPLPGWATLQPNASTKDFERVDKLLNASETAAGTQAQRETANAMRGQTFQLAKQAADETNYQHSAAALNAVGKPVTDLMQRFGRLQDTINQGTPQADALVAPELLSVMAGGSGSGLRMNEAEIARIVGGRSKWESLQANIQKWSLNPETANSITPDQRQQIRALVKTVGDKLTAKDQAIQTAHQELLGTSDPNQRRSIVGKAQQTLTDIDTKPAAQAPLLTNFHVNPKTGERIGWNGSAWVTAPQ